MSLPSSSTNKTYASKQPSVISGAPVLARTGRPGDPVSSPVLPSRFDPKSVSTDKYYRDGGIRGARAVMPSAPAYKPNLNMTDGSIALTSAYVADVAVVRDLVIDRLLTGMPVIVHVAEASGERALRTQLAMAVSRQQITEEQYKRVKFGLLAVPPSTSVTAPEVPGLPVINKQFGEPKPRETVVDDGGLALDVDPETFVKSDDPVGIPAIRGDGSPEAETVTLAADGDSNEQEETINTRTEDNGDEEGDDDGR